MKLCDVNVLVYAHRPDSTPEHALYAEWFLQWVTGPQAFAISEPVMAGFVRIVTNRRIFHEPTPVATALDFCSQLLSRPNALLLRPGSRNWAIFSDLCRQTGCTGKLVADAHHAALAIEYDCDWISTDADFARFPGLRWSHPLA